MPSLEANGVRLYYESSGHGPAIMFTHGASWDHCQWAPQVAAFHHRYHVIVWDVRGHGQSTLPDGPVDADDFNRDLIAVLDHLGISQAALCGLSMGGHISLQTAARYPDRVKALILIGTPFTNTYNWYERLFAPINRWSSRFVPMSLFAWLQARMLSRHNPAIRAYVEQATRQLHHERWLRLWQAITRMESRELLANIRCSTLILEGAHDWMTRRQQAHLVRHIRHTTHHLIPWAGHATNRDNPVAVNQRIAAFLAEQEEGEEIR